MYKGSSSRILPIIVILIVIAIAVAALISVGRSLFFSGSTTSDTPEENVGQTTLIDTSAGHSVRMTARGPIVANENFQSYQITVSPNGRNLNIYTGYLDQVKNSIDLSNNTKAYEEFVYALDRNDLMSGDPLKGDKDDTRGVCASGYVYEFEVLDGQSVKKRMWSATCRGAKGSLKANLTQVRQLFLEQIPDNKKILNKVRF